jgi:hypothetical protein
MGLLSTLVNVLSKTNREFNTVALGMLKSVFGLFLAYANRY